MIAANRPSPNSSSPSIPVRTCRFGYTRVDTVVPRVSVLSLSLPCYLYSAFQTVVTVNAHRRIARVIYDKHISEACGEPVNLPQTESRIILKALESELPLTRFLFDDAAEVCFFFV